jgi:uncharacterized protein (TIGR02246 family)
MKEKILSVLFVLLVGLTWVAADSAPDFKTAVEAATKDFEAAIVAKDAERVGSFYTEDAMVFPPNFEVVQGRGAIATFWKGFIDTGAAIKIEPTEVQDDGNLGLDSGKYRISGSDGKEVDHGKYVVVWKKENGVWKIYRDIWNTTMPAPSNP